jgi:outer membrane protein assembly factor BamD
VKKFPDSRYTPDATQRLIFLHNMLAKYEINAAEYYMKRGAYLAAANRAKYVIENYGRTPAAQDALKVLVRAYTKMGMGDLAGDARRVLDLNQPAKNQPATTAP